MNNEEIFALLIVLIIIFIIYLVPMIWVLVSGRSRGGAKFGWFILILFFSWLGLAAFLIFTQVTKLDKSRSGSLSGGDRVEPNISDPDR